MQTSNGRPCCITRGDAQCITNATRDAASSAEVAVTGVGGAAQVFEGRADMVRNGTVATGTMADVQLAQRVAGVRQQVCGGLSASACDTKITQLKGDEQAAALKLFGAAIAGTPLTKALIEAAPALAAAAKITVEACVASPVLCANQAGIAAGDIMAGDALGGAAVAVGTATAARKGLSKLEQEIAAVKGANGGTVPGGAANNATKGPLAGDLATLQAADPLIGTTLPGARAPVTVTAESTIGGKTIVDTNQTARPVTAADANKPTLISDLIPPGAPNSTMANAHAEVGLIQQAYGAGLTRGQPMTIVVRGEAVCTFCQSSNNLIAAADRAGLSSLTVVDTVAGKTYTWTRGNSGWSTPK